MLTHGAEPVWVSALNAAALGVKTTRAVLNRELVEPMREGLVGSDATIRMDCVCGGGLDGGPPQHEWDAFCQSERNTSELQSLIRNPSHGFCFKKKTHTK